MDIYNLGSSDKFCLSGTKATSGDGPVPSCDKAAPVPIGPHSLHHIAFPLITNLNAEDFNITKCLCSLRYPGFLSK